MESSTVPDHPSTSSVPLPFSSQHPKASTPSPPSKAVSLAAERLLRGVDHVEEAVLVSLLLVDLRDGRGHRHHAVLVHQQEEGLRGVQLQAAPGGGERGFSLDYPVTASHDSTVKWGKIDCVLAFLGAEAKPV